MVVGELMSDILFLKPVFKERIWGGKRLQTEFGYEIPYERTGECWAISAHPNGASMITEGPYQGMTLDVVYSKYRHLFNHHPSERFPLLTKILDANDDLSVQVHPDDVYGLKVENDLGKTECWYILEAEEDAEIIYGHSASSKDELKKMIDRGQWEQLLIRKKVKKGDFIYVPSGTIHAIGKGIMILESQQSSDTTYRLYDYDRTDDQGKKRELHIEKSKDVTNTPHITPELKFKSSQFNQSLITTFVSNAFFTVEKWEIKDRLSLKTNHFKLMSVIDGSGMINGHPIQKGSHFIITAMAKDIAFKGNLTLICSYV
jgi:mannose-6-phosphate isomerase